MWSSIVLSFKSQELQRPSYHAWIGCTGGGVSGMDSRSLNRKIRLRPRREFRGLAFCDLVRERDSVGRIRTEIGMSLEILEHGCDLGGPWEESSEDLRRDLCECERETLSRQRADDFVEAHE